MRIHASCAARDDDGVLLLGPSGVGKSDLLLRLFEHGFSLVADDQVCIEDGLAWAPDRLAGLMEVRGLGIMRWPFVKRTRLALAVQLARAPRMPSPARHAETALPLVSIDYRGDPRSGVVDALSTKVTDHTQVKVLAWYDNEWGYANRMVELARIVARGLA